MLPDLDAWDAWSPSTMSARLAGLTVPWCVAAGWALDLFLGRTTRAHGDLEIAIPAGSFAEVAPRFDDFEFFVPRSGLLFGLSDPQLRERALDPTGVDAFTAGHQTWARERATGKWRFDIFREPHDADTWVCRRDERIRRPYSELIEHTADGIPFLPPEIVLLFKAKNPRPKDEADFAVALPSLSAGRRQWLDDALALIYTDHPWRASLAAGTTQP